MVPFIYNVWNVAADVEEDVYRALWSDDWFPILFSDHHLIHGITGKTILTTLHSIVSVTQGVHINKHVINI